ncbi:MAG TPA: TIGR03790 family protein [Vicinamibacterales bacterium]|nr:TIGR03790 family protein [Vicinamibacterales bacterium]
MRDSAEPVSGRLIRFTQRRLLTACLVACALAWPDAARAQTAENVLVVINASHPASVKVGEHYVAVRKVPGKNIVRLTAGAAETISREEYERTIEQPIGNWLARHSLQDKVLYLVLAKGVPLRISGTPGRDGTASSVDSELTLLYRKLAGIRTAVVGRVENPYYLHQGALSEAKPFTRFLADIYLVTRLDGFTADDAIKLIDRAQAPARDGKIVLDQPGESTERIGDKWIIEAGDRIKELPGDRLLLETTAAPAASSAPVLGFFSWGSNDPAHRIRRHPLSFAKGALAATFVSTDGRTFTEPPESWVPGARPGADSESLAGDLIREGVTGVIANVSEPYLDATARPQIFFPAYLTGFNLAESFYLSMPFLGWQTIVVGDPLCAPFQQTPLRGEDIDKGMDAETELPALFAERRLARLAETGLNVESLKILLSADARLARDDGANIEPLLRRAIEVEPRLTIAHLRLAAMHEARAEFDQAIEQYRAVIAVEPQNVIALNNLAYALSERKQQPKEALPLALKAYRLAQTPDIADTVGWIHHLLGEDQAALPWLEQAAAGSPNSVEILIHAAVVHAALNDLTKARQELQAAEKLDPRIGTRSDVQKLRTRLKLEPFSLSCSEPPAGIRPSVSRFMQVLLYEEVRTALDVETFVPNS